MARTRKVGDKRTKRSANKERLTLLVHLDSQRKLRMLRGKIRWEGDLDSMRRD